MKKFLPVILFFCTYFVSAQTVFNDYTDGRLYVKFSRSALQVVARENPDNIPLTKLAALKDLVAKYGITRAYKPFYRAMNDEKLPYILRLEFSKAGKVSDLIYELQKIKGVEYAEKVPLMKTDIVPNDPVFPPHLTQINAANAWNVFNGNSNITVAIVDNAVMWTHQDLVANTYTNTGEIAGNAIDDDGNGYIDDVNGYDVADNDNNAVPTNTFMDHGTHCAGIAGARTDNSNGIASIGWNIKIIPVKTQIDGGSINGIAYGYEGIVYAANARARVISCSWGGGGAAISEQAVIDYAWNMGSIIIAAAGNGNTTVQNYPGAYNRVYCVASVSSSDIRSSFSNYGTWVDISAPGESVYSTTPNSTTGTYLSYSGTSMATPLVAGLAGLMLSKCSFMTQTDVLNCISSTAVNIYTLAGNSAYVTNSRLGAGRIEAYQAMNCAATFTAIPPVANFFTPTRNTCPLTPVVFYDSSQYAPTSWAWTFQSGTPATSTLSSPTVQWSNPGTYSVLLTVSNANGSDSETKLAYITVAGPIALPLVEGFQATTFLPANWTQNNILNDMIYWERRTGLGGFGTSTACAMFDNYNINALNERDEMKTPKYIFSNVANARLRFDVAYARYSATYSDTLQVKLSNDCGATWNSIYLKGGTILSTVANDVTANIFTPTSLQWRRDSIDISPLASFQGNVMFSFINRGHFGQPVYLDNINLVFPTPTLNITTPASRCVNTAFNFTNTSIGVGSYTWNMPGGSPATSTSSNPSTSYASAGLYTITLLVANGTTTASLTRTVNIVAPPNITVNTPTVCSGATAVLTASGATSYSWTNGPPTSAYSVAPPITSTYAVTGTANGCSTTGNATVFVNPVPSISINTVNVCSGSGAVLTASGATTYSWTNGPMTASISAIPPATSVFTVTGSNAFCSAIQTSTIFVTATPTVVASNPTICAGSSTILTASGAGSYLWSGGAITNTISVTAVANGSITVTGTNTGPAISCFSTRTIDITVNSLPFISILATSPSLCPGGSATLTASGANTYSWNTNATSSVIVVSPNTTSVYSVIGTSVCSSSAQVTLSITPIPLLTLSASPSTTICSGTTLTLTATGNYTSFSWGSSSAPASASLIIAPVNNSAYPIYAYGPNGCTTTATQSIIVNPNPISFVASANANCNNPCSGSASANTSNGTAPFSYNLVGGACPLPCNNLCAGNYTIVTTDAMGCTTSNSFAISATPNNLVATMSTTNAACQGCPNGAAMVNVSGGSGSYTYSWSPSTGTQAILNGLQPGCYTVTATDVNGCSVSSSTCVTTNDTTIGLSSISTDSGSLLVYPNPAHDQVVIDYTGTTFEYALYSSIGQLLAEKQNNHDKAEIKLSEFAKGIYFIEVRRETTTFRKKLVIE